MDRPPFSSGQIWRSFDVGNGFKDCLKGIGRAVQALLGSTGPVVTGFAASQSTSPSMVINVGAGQIYQLAAADATPIGSLPSDNTQVIQQGYTDAQELTFNLAALSAGQEYWALVQVQFEQSDAVRPGDPTGGVVPFFDSSNPTVPLQGPNGLGGLLNTVRLGFANVNIVYGAPAAIGSSTPPSPTTGFAPLYLVLLNASTTAVINNMIEVAGNAAFAGYQQAPFLAGLLNSHHGGINGQAPKIILSNAAEVQGVLPSANCHASPTIISGSPVGNLAGSVQDTAFDQTSGNMYICTASGDSTHAVWQAIASLKKGVGNPNGVVAGNAGTSPDLYVDVSTPKLWVCTSSGDATHAIWASSNDVPVGTILDSVCAGTALPPGFLLCDGSAVSRTTYAALFAITGTFYGIGNGTSTFNLPDSRGRASIGAGQGSGLSNRNLGTTGGEEEHQLTVAEMPFHSHGIPNGVFTSGEGYKNNFGTSGFDQTQGTGSSGFHNNMQPYIAFTKMIKY